MSSHVALEDPGFESWCLQTIISCTTILLQNLNVVKVWVRLCINICIRWTPNSKIRKEICPALESHSDNLNNSEHLISSITQSPKLHIKARCHLYSGCPNSPSAPWVKIQMEECVWHSWCENGTQWVAAIRTKLTIQKRFFKWKSSEKETFIFAS